MSRFQGISARLASRLRILGYSRNGRPDVGRFSREKDYRRQYLYAWLAGRVPGPQYLKRLARDLEVSESWLMLGAGEEAVVGLHGAPVPGRPGPPRRTSRPPAPAREDRAPGGKTPILDFQKLRDLRDLAAKLVHAEADLRAAVTLLAGAKQVLEMIATGAPLPRVLDTLCRTIEEESDRMLCSVLLLDADGAHLRHGAAPSLAEEYVRAINGLPIGPSAGSCGTAAYRKATVIVSDIATDPRWALYRELAARYGLGACWSVPVLGSDGAVLGTFAMYYHAPRGPSARELQLIERARDIAGIAIERTRTEAALRQSEEKYRALVTNIPSVPWTADREGRVTFISPNVERVLGVTAEEVYRASEAVWPGRVHPDDIERVREARARLFAATEPVQSEVEYRVRTTDDRWVWLHDRAVATFHAGQPYVCGAFTDVTGRKRAEETTRALAEVGRTLSQSLDPAVVGRIITRSVRDLSHAENAVLFRVEPETGCLVSLSECLRSGATSARGLVLPPGTGVAGLALRDGRAVATSDILADARVTLTPDVRRWVEQDGYRAVLAVPLIVTGSAIGALTLGHRESRTFSVEDIRLLETFADQAAIALQNALLLEEADRRRRAAESLTEIVRLLSETLDPEEVARRIADSVRPLLGLESAIVYRLEPESGDLVPLAASSDSAPLRGSPLVLPRGAGAVGLAVREGRTVSTPNGLADRRIEMPREVVARFEHPPDRAVLAIPLTARRRIIGALGLRAAEGRVFGASEVALAETFAGQAGLALENARLLRESQARLAACCPPPPGA